MPHSKGYVNDKAIVIVVPLSIFNWDKSLVCKVKTFLAPYVKIQLFVGFKNKFQFFFFFRLKVSKFVMLIADPLPIKNRTDIPSSAKSCLKIDKVCTSAVELSLRTDSPVSVC